MNETASGMTGPQDHQATGRPAVRPQLLAIGYRLSPIGYCRFAIGYRFASPRFNVLTFLTLLTFVTSPCWALTAENPYLSLTNRNCFQLKAPPKPPTEEELRAKQPPPPITLTGISTIFGSKKALLVLGPIPGQPAKPGTNPAEAGKPQSFILCEGQREGDLEVLKINEKAGAVDITYAGQPATLTFEKNGAKGGGSGGGAPGGVPSPTGIPFPQGRPMAMPAGFNPANQGNLPAMPLRQMRTEGSGVPGAPDAVPPGFGGVMTARPPATPPPPVDMDQQELLIEAHRMANPEVAPILPPTSLTPALKGEQNKDGAPENSEGPPGF